MLKLKLGWALFKAKTENAKLKKALKLVQEREEIWLERIIELEARLVELKCQPEMTDSNHG